MLIAAAGATFRPSHVGSPRPGDPIFVAEVIIVVIVVMAVGAFAISIGGSGAALRSRSSRVVSMQSCRCHGSPVRVRCHCGSDGAAVVPVQGG